MTRIEKAAAEWIEKPWMADGITGFAAGAAWAIAEAAKVAEEYKPFDHGACQCFSCNRDPLAAAIRRIGES